MTCSHVTCVHVSSHLTNGSHLLHYSSLQLLPPILLGSKGGIKAFQELCKAARERAPPAAALRHRPPLPSPHPTSTLLPIQMNHCMWLLSLHEVYMMVCKLLHFHGFYINLWLLVITLYGRTCTYPFSNALTFQTIHLQHGCSSVKAVNSEPANTSVHRMTRKRSDGTNDTISLVSDSYLRLKTDLCGVYVVHMYIRTHTYTYVHIHTYLRMYTRTIETCTIGTSAPLHSDNSTPYSPYEY